MSLFDIIGDIFGANSQSKAINKATDAQTNATNQALALQKQSLDQQQANLQPYLTTGTSALDKLAGLYGLASPYSTPTTGAAALTASQPLQGGSYEGFSTGGLTPAQTKAINAARPDVAAKFATLSSGVKSAFGNDPDQYTDYWYNRYGQGNGTDYFANLPSAGSSSTVTAPAPSPGYTNAQGGASTVDPNASFYESPDYNFKLQQGLNGLVTRGAAGNGTDNGALRKAEIGYAGDLASSAYDGYVSKLQSLAGVGQSASTASNSAISSTANNSTNLATTQGNNLASSYLGQGQVNSNLIGGIAGSAGGAISSGIKYLTGFDL